MSLKQTQAYFLKRNVDGVRSSLQRLEEKVENAMSYRYAQLIKARGHSYALPTVLRSMTDCVAGSLKARLAPIAEDQRSCVHVVMVFVHLQGDINQAAQ